MTDNQLPDAPHDRSPQPDPRRGSLTRRRLLGAGGLLAAGAVVPTVFGPGTGTAHAASSSGRVAASALPATQQAALKALGRDTMRLPGSLPFPNKPAGTDMLPGIENIVVMVMENHSFDNMFGMLGRGDGFTLNAQGRPTASNPYPGWGVTQNAFRMPTTCQLSGQPTQTWNTSHGCFADGAMDGFVSTPLDGPTTTAQTNCDLNGAVAMGYFTGADVPFTYSLASKFPIGDRWFCSLLGQTSPQRRYVIGATSAGMCDDPGTSLTTSEIIADLSLAVPVGGTIFNQLDAHGITWANYAAGSWPLNTSPEEFPVNDTLTELAHLKSWSQFFVDAAAGNLPQFSFLDEDYNNDSQENPANVVYGDALLSSVVEAIGTSPQWSKTLLLITYDEHGGYYDHVPPPAALAPDGFPPLAYPAFDGFERYGFRVPSVVVSPYAKKDYVSHVLHDHGSIPALLERKWNLPALTYRDANANDVLDFIDLEALAAHKPTFPNLPPLAAPGNTPGRLACNSSGPGTIPPAGSYTFVLAGQAQAGMRAANGSWTPGASPASGFFSIRPNSPTVITPDFVANFMDLAVSQQTAGGGNTFWAATGADNNAYLQVQSNAATGGGFLGFQHLPGNGSAPYFSAKRLAVAAMPDGDAQIIAIGQDGNLYHTIYAAATDTFQSWSALNFAGSDAGIAALPTGDSIVVTIGTNGQISYNIRSASSGSWQGFTTAPVEPGLPTVGVAVAADPSTGDAHVVAVNDAGDTYDITRTAGTGAWSSSAGTNAWNQIGKSSASNVVRAASAEVAVTADHAVHVAIVAVASDVVWYQVLKPSAGAWNNLIAPKGFKPTQGAAISAYANAAAGNAFTDVAVYTVQVGPGKP